MQAFGRAGAELDVADKQGKTPLQMAIVGGAKQCAEYLLYVGAKISNLKYKRFPKWFTAMIDKHKTCAESCFALYGVLRKRWIIDGYRVPRDMITVLTRLLWESRRNDQWQHLERNAKVLKPCKHKCADKESCGHSCCK